MTYLAWIISLMIVGFGLFYPVVFLFVLVGWLFLGEDYDRDFK